MRYRQLNRQTGVTLIELVVAMAIVGILTALAYPSYQGHVAKTRRQAATACLSQYANFMERYYTTNLSYAGAAPVMGCSTESGMDRFYSFPAPAIGANSRTYSISAVPTTSQQSKDPNRCGTLTLDQAGARTPTSSACW